MANRRFEMYQYRQILSRMRLGDSDRDLARAGLVGRRKAGQLREVASSQGWLDPIRPLPDEAELAAVLAASRKQPETASLVEPYRELGSGLGHGRHRRHHHPGRALMRNHGFAGSYSAVAVASRSWSASA